MTAYSSANHHILFIKHLNSFYLSPSDWNFNINSIQLFESCKMCQKFSFNSLTRTLPHLTQVTLQTASARQAVEHVLCCFRFTWFPNWILCNYCPHFISQQTIFWYNAFTSHVIYHGKKVYLVFCVLLLLFYLYIKWKFICFLKGKQHYCYLLPMEREWPLI